MRMLNGNFGSQRGGRRRRSQLTGRRRGQLTGRQRRRRNKNARKAQIKKKSGFWPTVGSVIAGMTWGYISSTLVEIINNNKFKLF